MIGFKIVSANENFSDSAINGTFQPWALWPSNSSTSVVERHQWGAFRQIEAWHKPIGLVWSRFFFQQKILRAKKRPCHDKCHMESEFICLFEEGEIKSFINLPFWVFPFFLSARQTRLICYGVLFCGLKNLIVIESPLTFSKGKTLKISKNQVRYTSFSPKTLQQKTTRIWGPKRWIQGFCSQKPKEQKDEVQK